MTLLENLVPKEAGRFQVLDGWRGISILAVLACHLLPIGPHTWLLNEAAGYFGMALFFALSGFLITNFLLHHTSVVDFLIRRTFRILPLAWIALTIGLWMAHADSERYIANFFFFANIPPFWLTDVTGHFWSLCVEIQFYAGIAILFAILGPRGLLLLPVVCLGITALRVHETMYGSIVTYYRVDEILAGATLALVYNDKLGQIAKAFLQRVNPWILIVLLVISTHPAARFMDYFRPYLSATLIGATLMQPDSQFARAMRSKTLAYVAAISYALYVVHPMLEATWLGSGAKLVKYAKRPLLFVAVFLVAHISTSYYEHRWIEFGKRLSARFQAWAAKSRIRASSI